MIFFSTYPFDALEQIFLQLVKQEAPSIERTTIIFKSLTEWPAPPVAALALSQVCRRWCSAALSSRPLWRTVQVNVCKIISEGSSAYLDMLLIRSRDTPLNVMLHHDEKLSTNSTPSWPPARKVCSSTFAERTWSQACYTPY